MKILRILAPIFITVIILFLLFKSFDVYEVIAVFKVSNIYMLAFYGLLLITISPLISALRWQYVLKLLNCRLTLNEAFKLYMASIPISKISPANTGDMIRAYYLKDKIKPSLNTGGIIFERMLDFLVIAIMAVIGGIIIKLTAAITIGLLIILSLLTLYLVLPRLKIKSKSKWQNKINSFLSVFEITRKNPLSLAVLLFYTFLLWSVILIYIKFTFYNFNASVPLLSILTIQPIVIFFSLIPVTLSGIGTREAAMLYLYSSFSSAPAILATGLSYSFFASILFPLLGIPFMLKTFYKK